MTRSEQFLAVAAILILIANGLIVVGGSIAFTLACMAFIGAGACCDRFLVELQLEKYAKSLEEALTESDAEFEATIDYDSLTDEEKEFMERVLGFKPDEEDKQKEE